MVLAQIEVSTDRIHTQAPLPSERLHSHDKGPLAGQLFFVVGGAVSGAEAASYLASRGAIVGVFEQNADPFGKVRRGLPIFHAKQQRSEYEKLTQQLEASGVYFFPNTGVGSVVSITELQSYRPSGILIASGAWRDRPLGVDGAEAFDPDHGFIYQNEYIGLFNFMGEGQGDWRRFPSPGVIFWQGGRIGVYRLCQGRYVCAGRSGDQAVDERICEY